MSVAVRFDNVSKRFILHHERPRSFQELAISLFRRNNSGREEFWALRDVSFVVKQGETVGIIGPNGAGKSTVLKLISRIIEPTSGRIRVRGKMGALLELGAGFHPDLTGRENIYLNGSILGLSRTQIRRKLDGIIAFAELERFIDVPVKLYSSGMYVRLGFSVAVHTDPEVLLVDEVLAVGDTTFQHKCLDKIAELRRAGVAIVLVSHGLGTIQSLCEQAIWLEEGRVQAHGCPLDVVMAYLNSVAAKEDIATSQSFTEPEQGQRWGTGRIQITRVELCDGQGIPRSVFVTGATLKVQLHYWATERVEEPVFGLAIHHQNGVHICGPNTRFGGLHIPYVEGEGRVVYHIPSLPLLEGAYTLSVSAHNRADTEMYDYHDRAYSFRVHPGKSREQYGLVTLRGEWQFPTALEPTGATTVAEYQSA